MERRLKLYFTGIFAAAVLSLTLAGCGSKTENTASTAQPTATPNNLVMQASPSPTVETSMRAASSPNAVQPKAQGSGSGAPASSAGPAGAPGGSAGSARSSSAPGEASAARAAVAPTPAPTPRVFTLPAGSTISIYTAKTLSTKTDKSGQRFTASLAKPIVDDDWVIAKRGALVEGEVVTSDPGGRVEGRATMTVELRSLQLADGRTVSLASSGYTKEAKSTKKKDALKVGIGAGLGAAIGAIAGGGKGAAIGAGAGGAGGAGYVLATRGDPAVIPSESQLTFRLRAPITVTRR
jgi:hypothetical protein